MQNDSNDRVKEDAEDWHGPVIPPVDIARNVAENFVDKLLLQIMEPNPDIVEDADVNVVKMPHLRLVKRD